jgi:two-component system, NarL family, nitrate/nitrite response regulator NarL
MNAQRYSPFESKHYETRNGTGAIRILLAHDHPVMRIGVGNLLQKDGDLEIVAEAGNNKEALSHALELEPDILLLDLNMLTLRGLKDLHAALNDAFEARIILLTTAISVSETMEILELGIRGIVPKDSLTEQLIPAIRSVIADHYWIEGRRTLKLPDILHTLTEDTSAPKSTHYGLTPRELEVIQCIMEGSSNRDIAQKFQLSEETIKRHLSNIFDKTGVSTRLELALFAIEHQLVASKK